MPDLSLQGLSSFAGIPQQMSNNFFAGPMNMANLQHQQLQNSALSAQLPYVGSMANATLAGQQSQNQAQNILNQYNPAIMQNQAIAGSLGNQAAQAQLPYAGQQSAAAVALANAQAQLAGTQANFYPASIKAKLLGDAIRYGSPDLKAGYSAAMVNGQPNLGAIPVMNLSSLGGGQPQQQMSPADQLAQQYATSFRQQAPQAPLGIGMQGQASGPSSGPFPVAPPMDAITAATQNALQQKLDNPAPPALTQKWQNASNLMQTTNMLKDYLAAIPNLDKYTGLTGEANYHYQDALPKDEPRDPGFYQVKVIKDQILPGLSKQLQKYAVGSTNGALLMKTEDDLDPFGPNSTSATVQNGLSAISDLVNRESQTSAIGAGKLGEYQNLAAGKMADGSNAKLPVPAFNNKQDFQNWFAVLPPQFKQKYIAQMQGAQ